MAKQEKGTKTPKFDPTELRKLWKQPTENWMTLLNTVGAQQVKPAGHTIKLQCPYHPDTNPSGTLNIHKGHFKCFACNTYITDPIKFASKYIQGSYMDVARTFRDHFKIEKLDLKKLDETELEQHRMKLLSDVFHRYLCNVWVADKAPQSAVSTVTWLKNRGLTSVDMLGCIGMLPTSVDLQKLCAQAGANEDDILWCMRLVSDYLNVTYMNCVVYTYGLSPDKLTAFKLRIPGPDKESVRFIKSGDTVELGAFGLNVSAFYKHYSSEKVTRFTAVEGEHDALAFIQGMLTHCADVDEVVIALGGAGHNGVDFMADLGFSECRLIGDDDAAGDLYPTSVLPKTRNVAIQVFKWPQRIRNHVPGKIDPDEAIKVHGFDIVYREFCNPKNYEFATRWCADRAKLKIAAIHPDNVIGLQEVATEFTGYLKNDTERQVFAEEFNKICPSLPASEILRHTRLKDDSSLGFVEKIKDWMGETYQTTTWDSHTGVLKLWNKKLKQYLYVQVNKDSAMTQFARYTSKGSMYYWARDEIGLPSYFPDVEAPDAGQTALDKTEDMIENAVQRAYRMLSAESVDEAKTRVKGQGIHLDHTQNGAPGYFINGNSIYKLKWSPDFGKLSAVTELEGPFDNGQVFDLEHRYNLIDDMHVGWTELIKSPKDLMQRPVYSPFECFQKVHKLINLGFEFKNQEVDSLYCAGLVFYNYLYDVMPTRRMLTHFYAQFESGKTTLLSITSNHPQLREFSLCDHALALDTFTQAAFYQTFTNTRLVAVLDEMNDPDDGSMESRNRKLFYQRTRSLATSGSTTLNQGTVDGKGRSFNIANTVITASGTPIHDPMDESRFNTINLKKNANRNNVRLLLRAAFTSTEIQNLRLSILINAITLAPNVATQYAYLYDRYGSRREADDKGTTTIQNVDRFTENLMPMAAILNVFGQNGQQFIDKYRDTRKQQVYERAHSTPGHALIDTILTSSIPSREEENQMTTIKALLLHPHDREKINNTKVGVYYDDVCKCLGVVWSEVRLNLLKNQYKTRTPFALKAEAETVSDWILHRPEADKLGITRRLMAKGMTSSSSVYSIITVQDLIARHEEAVGADQKEEDARVAALNPPKEISFREAPASAVDPLEGLG